MVTVLRRSLLWIGILSACFLTISAAAQEIADPTEEILSSAGAHRQEITQMMTSEWSAAKILTTLGNLFLGEIKGMTERLPVLIVLMIVTGIKSCMDFPLSLNRYVSLGCFSAAALVTGEIFRELSSLANELISHLGEFVYLTIPALTGLVANGGRVLTAAKSTYFILSFMNVVVWLIEQFFLPMILLFFVCSVLSAMLEQGYFQAVKRLILSLNQTVLPLVIGIFMTVLTIITSVSKASDEMTLQAAKMALGNCIPFLGSALMESGAYLIQTVSGIKAQAGLAGILVLCYLFLVPLIKLLSGMLVMRALSVSACFFSDEKITVFYEDVSTALGMLAGVVSTVSVITILSVMILMGI